MKLYALVALAASATAIKVTSHEATSLEEHETEEAEYRMTPIPSYGKVPPPSDCREPIKGWATKLYGKLQKGRNFYWASKWFGINGYTAEGITWEECLAQPNNDVNQWSGSNGSNG